MNKFSKRVTWVTRRMAFALALVMSASAQAHGVSKGDLELDHPYAIPSAPGALLGKAFLRGIHNTGAAPDRLLSASTPLAASVELHSLKFDAGGLHEERIDSIALPPQTVTRLRHTGDYQLTLMDLKKPLVDGDRFDLTLNFQHAGTETVRVWVQTPRETPGHEHAH